MSEAFKEWSDAKARADGLAEACRIDVAIRKTKEYGKTVYVVGFASRNDSDYDRAEIVRPPRWT